MDYSKVKKGVSEIKVTDIYHEINGDESIWVTFYYKGKTFSLSHDVATIKKGCEESFDDANLGEQDLIKNQKKRLYGLLI